MSKELKYEAPSYSIIGAISDATKEEIDLFYKAAEKLKMRGYKVFNPVEYEKLNPGLTWIQYMEVCIQELIKNKHALVLPTIWKSRGGSEELRICVNFEYVIEDYNAF